MADRPLTALYGSTAALQRLDLDYHASILPGVSRTFALTIPVLPDRLATLVTNAYLLCRIADTIEDDAALTDRHKTQFHKRYLSVIEGREDAETFDGDRICRPCCRQRPYPTNATW